MSSTSTGPSGTFRGPSGTAIATGQSRPSLQDQSFISRWPLALCLLLGIAALAIYYPVNHFSFLPSVDDSGYVTDNVHVLGPLDWTEVRWAFTHTFLLNYDPLTFLAHSINVRIFHLNAGRHHDVNVVLHVLDALLLFWLLRRSTGFTARSFVVAALFTVHPINVENVAWVSELKTLLSTGFFFAAMIVYLWYARRPKWWRMLCVGFVYGLGLLAKPQIITFPFVLLLWDYWPLHRMFAATQTTVPGVAGKRDFLPQRLRRLVIEKIPLFLITAVDILITLHAENKPDLERYTFAIRLGTAIRSYAVYVGKALWPVNLGFDYPHPGYSLRWPEVWAALALLVAITAAVLAYRKQRYLLVGWFWFVGTMLPTINLVQIDTAAVADRYAYICFVGLFLMACWGLAELAHQQHLSRALLPAVTASVLVVLSAVSHHQVRYWQDEFAVWNRSLQVAPVNPGAEWALGNLMVHHGDVEQGIVHMQRSFEEAPRNSTDTMFMAEVQHQHGDYRKALLYYQKALALSTDKRMNAEMYANMGHVYGSLGDEANALRCYVEAQRIRESLPGRK